MKIRTATVEDSKGILALDYAIFPEVWHVKPDFVERILDKNKEIYRVLEVKGEIKGHYCVFPFKQEQYEQLLTGKMSEDDSIEFIQPYGEQQPLCLYVATIIVDIKDPGRKVYAEMLQKDLMLFLKKLTNRGNQIQEIGSIAITRTGSLLCRKFKMKQTETHPDGKVYRRNFDFN